MAATLEYDGECLVYLDGISIGDNKVMFDNLTIRTPGGDMVVGTETENGYPVLRWIPTSNLREDD